VITLKGREVGRHRFEYEGNIKIDLKETGYDGLDWIHLAQDRFQWRALVNTVMNLGVPYKAGNFLTS
jgi:hypothetical protein